MGIPINEFITMIHENEAHGKPTDQLYKLASRVLQRKISLEIRRFC